MKQIIKRQIMMMSIILLSSCSDLFNDDLIKQNPNAVEEASVSREALLAGALLGVGRLHEDTDVRLAYMWSGQMTGSNRQHLALAQYIVSASSFGWTDYYAIAANAHLLQEKSDVVGDTWIKGIGQVAEALVMTKVASLWGDAPYKEAFNITEFPNPHYDGQVELYNEIIATLDAAIANMSMPTGSDAGSHDIIYGGKVAKWIAAANTLKARLYLHLGDYPNAIASAGLGIADGDGDALFPHGKAQTIDQNMNFSFFVNTRSGDTNFSNPAVLPSLMEASDFQRNAKTNEKALYNHFFKFGGIVADALDANVDADGFFAQDASQPVLTFYENQLILAEAAARSSQPGIAIAALNSVRAVLATGYINGRTISTANKDLGLKYDPYTAADFATTTDLIYEIMLTKYTVTLSQYESLNDVRRLKKAQPIVTLPVTPIVSTPTGDIPARFIVPQEEINTNTNIPVIVDQYVKLPIFQ